TFGSWQPPCTARSSTCAAASKRDCSASATGTATGTASGGIGTSPFLDLAVQQPLPRAHQRQGHQPPQAPVAQPELARLAEAAGGRLVAPALEGRQAGQQHRLPQRLVQAPAGPRLGVNGAPPADGVVILPRVEAELA